MAKSNLEISTTLFKINPLLPLTNLVYSAKKYSNS